MDKILKQLFYSLLIVTVTPSALLISEEEVASKSLWDVFGPWAKDTTAACLTGLKDATVGCVKAPFKCAIEYPKQTAIGAALFYTGYATKQWWRGSQVLKEVEKCCKIPEYDSDSKSNPYWVVKELTVDQLRDRSFQNEDVLNFIANDVNKNILKSEQSKIKHLMNQLEHYTSVKRKIAKFVEQRYINLNEPLNQNNVAQLEYDVHHWLEESLNTDLNWQWTRLSPSVGKYISNIYVLTCRITSNLYKPFEKKAAQAYWKLWKKNQQFIALADRMNA